MFLYASYDPKDIAAISIAYDDPDSYRECGATKAGNKNIYYEEASFLLGLLFFI